MIDEQQISTVIGSTAVGPDGKHGTVGEVYLDDETGRPEWATVRTGLFGTKEAFVPLADATVQGNELRLPYDKDKVKKAPHVDVSAGHLSPQGKGRSDAAGLVDALLAYLDPRRTPPA